VYANLKPLHKKEYHKVYIPWDEEGSLMNIYTTSQAKNELVKLVDDANETHEPIYIVGTHNKAVLIAEDDYSAMLETLHIVSVPGLKESILDMHRQPKQEYSKDIDL
jgi:antitoxin YefM